MVSREYEKVTNYIVEQIRTRKLTIGSKLPSERTLAAQLGISRNSTREALRNLENMGIIECRQGSGSYVRCEMTKVLSSMFGLLFNLENISIIDLNIFRKAFDKVVCSMLIDKNDDLTELADRATKLLDSEPEDHDEEIKIDHDFHYMLLEATDNPLMRVVSVSLSEMYNESINTVLQASRKENKDGFLDAHRRIVEALKSGSKAKCDDAVNLHYERVDEIIRQAKLVEYIKNKNVDAGSMFQLQTLDEYSGRDYLTGLYSKETFFEKVDKYIKAHPSEQLMLWACDIQGLRFINEKNGMEAGDRVLQNVAELGRKFDNYVIGGRIDGDNLCALMRDEGEFDKSSNRLLYDKYKSESLLNNITIKNGIYHIKKNDSLGVQAMYVRAVLALQSIKNSYGDSIKEYDDKMREELLVTRQIVEDADNALERNDFQVYYQPKISVENKDVSGAEALVRWFHPELGYLHPGLFIDLFEENGFITKLDLYIWEEVCKTIVDWQKRGIKVVPISVNVSKKSFEDANLAEKIIELVDRYGIDHSLFEIEITEYSCLGNPDMIQNTIKQLHDAGFVIALDDFGTGYSSMIVLSRMHLDILKLDISLILNDNADAKTNALEFAMKLAHMMNLKTVAEGIETEKQVRRIEELGADYIQGYFYSKPIPKADFEDFMTRL